MASPQSSPSSPPPAEPPPRLPLDGKRLLDLVAGSALLLLAAPLLTVAALAAALRTGGRPPLVRRPVTGLGGRPFTLRFLPVRWLRLDLLSRLPHVVRGEMSLVGPAPLPPGTPGAGAAWRATVRPGLTGPAQLRRGSALPWEEPLLLDQEYVEHRRTGTDLILLLRTASLAAPLIARAPATAAAPVPAATRGRTRIPARGRLPGPLRLPLRTLVRGRGRASGQAHLSDTDHRRRRYSAAG